MGSLIAAKAMVNDVSSTIAMPSDYCTIGKGSPYGNDDLIKRAIGSVMTENVICILLIVIVILVTAGIVYYVGRVLYSVTREYSEHLSQTKKIDVEIEDEGDEEDDVYDDVPRLPKVPEVTSVKKRIVDIEKRYKGYNEAISRRRDGTEAVMDSRIISRSNDNYTYKKGPSEPIVRV